MFRVAAKAVAGMVSETNLEQGSLFPDLDQIRDVSLEIALALDNSAAVFKCFPESWKIAV